MAAVRASLRRAAERARVIGAADGGAWDGGFMAATVIHVP
jgi:hypothetical protein